MISRATKNLSIFISTGFLFVFFCAIIKLLMWYRVNRSRSQYGIVIGSVLFILIMIGIFVLANKFVAQVLLFAEMSPKKVNSRDGEYISVTNKYGKIKIKTIGNGKIFAEGSTVFDNGSSAPPKGDFEGYLVMDGDNGYFADQYSDFSKIGCALMIQFLSNSEIVVRDVENHACGGEGVTFGGKYVKK